MQKSIAVFLVAGLMSWTASAGPLDEKRAERHLAAVATGDLEVLMADYVDDAYMDWVGGPLDGRYRGRDAIREVWKKFAAANDGQARPVRRGKLEVYAHPKGVSITVDAEYGGKVPVKVWHALVYRDGQLTSELWQIAPALQIHD